MSNVQRKKKSKADWGIYETKDGKPVFAVERDAHAILRDFMLKVARMDGPEMVKTFDINEELNLFEKKRAALVLVGMADLPGLCKLFDKNAGTDTVIHDETAFVLPGTEHDGVGFRALILGDIVEYWDDAKEEWINAAYCGIKYVDGKLPVQLDDGTKVQVEPHLVKRSA